MALLMAPAYGAFWFQDVYSGFGLGWRGQLQFDCKRQMRL
jgi:hypothetical protein